MSDHGVKPPTPGQTVGPFFHYALPFAGDRDLVAPGTLNALRLYGTVTDGAGAPIPDALIEIWQADPAGHIPQRTGTLRRDGHTFTGFGRASTDREGGYSFTTLTPGPVGNSRPFFALAVLARGLLDRLLTRAYLPLDDALPDAVLAGAGERAATMMCSPDDSGWRFDIALQGDAETVFLTHTTD